MNIWRCVPVKVIDHEGSDSGNENYRLDNRSTCFIVYIQQYDQTQGDRCMNNQLNDNKGYMNEIVSWMVTRSGRVQVG